MLDKLSGQQASDLDQNTSSLLHIELESYTQDLVDRYLSNHKRLDSVGNNGDVAKCSGLYFHETQPHPTDFSLVSSLRTVGRCKAMRRAAHSRKIIEIYLYVFKMLIGFRCGMEFVINLFKSGGRHEKNKREADRYAERHDLC